MKIVRVVNHCKNNQVLKVEDKVVKNIFVSCYDTKLNCIHRML